MSRDEVCAHALASPIFRGLDHAQVDGIVTECVARELGAGETLITRGSRGSELYFLLSGRLRVFVPEGAQERDLAELSPPAVVGEMELLTGHERVATVSVLERATLLALPFARARFRIEAGDPACLRVLFNVSTVIADRLDKTVHMLTEVGRGTSRAEELADFRRKLFSEWTF